MAAKVISNPKGLGCPFVWKVVNLDKLCKLFFFQKKNLHVKGHFAACLVCGKIILRRLEMKKLLNIVLYFSKANREAREIITLLEKEEKANYNAEHGIY